MNVLFIPTLDIYELEKIQIIQEPDVLLKTCRLKQRKKKEKKRHDGVMRQIFTT